EYLAGWQRERADFLNYKKEEMERMGEFLKYAGEEMVLKLLPILDSFQLAEKKLPDNLKNDENVKGLLMIKGQIEDFLKSQGVEEIKTTGEKFDLNFMEEVEKEEQEQKGYKINNKILRVAKIKL
ncbi:MAG: nucleotide exchange factor GrpE, partial [bacterium]